MINLYIRNCKFIILNLIYAQRARGKLIREVEKSFTVDVFVGNVTDGEKVCMGNLVGLPVLVVPTGLKNISEPPTNNCRRRTTINAGIYAPPERDHIVSKPKRILLIDYVSGL